MGHAINTRNQFRADGGSVKSIKKYLLSAMNPYIRPEEQIKWMQDNFNHIPEYKKIIDKLKKTWKIKKTFGY